MVPEFEERTAAELAGIAFPTWRTETGPAERGGAIAYARYKRLVEAHVSEASQEAAEREARRKSSAKGGR
jgi:hypothetical protein